MHNVSIWFVLLWLLLCKGDFSLKPPSVTKNLGETLHTSNPVGYTLNLLFIQSLHLHSFLTLWWEAADAFALELLQAGSLFST